MTAILSQYCIYVSDIERAIEFWDSVIGVPLVSRTDLGDIAEAILQSPHGGSRLQLAQKLEDPAPIAMGSALWKLGVNTSDCRALHDRAVDAGCESVMVPVEHDQLRATIASVKNFDGYLFELVEFHAGTGTGVPDPKEIAASSGELVSILSQYCIYVSDLERSIGFWADAIGVALVTRTGSDSAGQAILRSPHGGSTMQLDQKPDTSSPVDMGNAMWKLYVNTDDCEALYQRAVDAGCESVMVPTPLDRWPVTMAYVKDRDGYLVEFVESHAGVPPGVPDPKTVASLG